MVAEKINEVFSSYPEGFYRWMGMLTEEFEQISENYDYTNSALLSTNTYAAVEEEIDKIMKENGVSEYAINSSLHPDCDGGMYIANFTISYMQDGMKTTTFKIETMY